MPKKKTKKVWLLRHQWHRGKLHTAIINTTTTAAELLPFKPVAPEYSNHWFERTQWWRHRKGWAFQGERFGHWRKRSWTGTNRFLDTPIAKYILLPMAGAALALFIKSCFAAD